MSLPSLIAPFGTIAVLGTVGLGLAGLIAPRASRDAQAALAAPVTSAVIFVTSPIVLLDKSPRLTAAIVVGCLATVTVARRRESVAIARRATAPAVIASLAILVYASPAFKHGTWAAATTGNQDAYIWVSQARSIEDGPPRGADSTSPDLIPYHRLTREAWPTAIPGGLAELAAATRVDPVQAYGVFEVVIAAMLALAVFFGARGCLCWSRRRSVIAALVVSLNGLMLISSFYGWQAQLLLTTAGTLFILMLPECLERTARIRDCIGPALFAASAIAVYGWTIAPFVVAAGAVCWTYWRHRRKTVSLQLFAFRLATIAVLTAAFGAVGITRAVITLARASQHKSAAVLSLWRQYAWAFPSDALGLVPRTPRDVPGVGWEVLALTVGSVLIVRGLVSARSSQKPRNRVLATAGLTLIVELIAVALSGSTPYVSLKLMAYSSPLLTLLVVGSDSWMSQTAGLHGQVARLKALGRASVNVVAPLLFLATTGFALSAGLGKTRPATEVLPVARAAAALPRGKVIQLRVGDAWDQVWLAYFLRDRPIAISAPSVAFIGYSARDAARARTFNASAAFVIRERSPGSYVWRDGKFGIYAVRNSSSG